jgi:membrane-associated phospholipid phosphatase
VGGIVRRHPDGRFGLSLVLACVAVLAVGVLLALVDARWVPLRHLDDAATRETNAYVRHNAGLVGPLRATAYVFGPWVFRVVVVVLAAWLARRGARRTAIWAVAAMVVTGVVEWTLKTLVGRPRPIVPRPIAHAPGASFPSGHALTAAVGCAVIVLILRRTWRATVWVAAVVISLVAGACRVLLGVHYVSDVVAGWILGIAIVLATYSAAKPFGGK